MLVEALDLLSRAPPSKSQVLLLELINSGIFVVTLIDGRVYDRKTVDRDPFALMDSVMKLYAAHEESLKKSERFNNLFEARRNSLSPIIGFTAPGWLKKRADKSGWELISERAESVVRLFEATLAGQGGVVIAKTANAEKWTPLSKNSKSWHQASLSKILKNRACIGEYQPMKMQEGKLLPTGLPIPDFFPRVVSEDLFNRVQAVLSERSRIPRRRDNGCMNVLAGLLICGNCGATLALKRGSTKEHYLSRYYVCADRVRGIQASQDCRSFHAGDLLAPSEQPRRYRKQAQLLTLALLAALMRHIAEHVSREERIASISGNLTSVEANLSSAKYTLNNLLKVAEAGAAEAPELAKRIQDFSKQVKELESARQGLKLALISASSIQTEDDIDTAIHTAVRAVRDPEAIEERSRLRDKLLQLVDHVWLWPGIAALRLKGETLIRWLPLHAETARMILKPPQIPPMRKHLDRKGG